MRIIANDYEEKDIIKMIRQYVDMQQGEFGKIVRKSKMSIQSYELGRRDYNFKFLMLVAKKFDLVITIESKNSIKIRNNR